MRSSSPTRARSRRRSRPPRSISSSTASTVSRRAAGGSWSGNSCREPWRNIIDLSIRQSLPGFQGHRLALQLDIFNFTNLLNEKWGEVARTPGGFSNVNLLTHVGQTPGPFEDSQGIFQFALNQERYNTQNLASNYQLQLSVRYSY